MRVMSMALGELQSGSPGACSVGGMATGGTRSTDSPKPSTPSTAAARPLNTEGGANGGGGGGGGAAPGETTPVFSGRRSARRRLSDAATMRAPASPKLDILVAMASGSASVDDLCALSDDDKATYHHPHRRAGGLRGALGSSGSLGSGGGDGAVEGDVGVGVFWVSAQHPHERRPLVHGGVEVGVPCPTPPAVQGRAQGWRSSQVCLSCRNGHVVYERRQRSAHHRV